MKRGITLNGSWELYYFEDEVCLLEVENSTKAPLKATVPGNIELALADAGIVEKDLYKGMATVRNQKFEDYDFWYKKEFNAPEMKDNERLHLVFSSVDCIAEYYLNGQKIFESDNAFIEQRFEITECVKERNTLYVHIKSAVKYAYSQEFNQYLAACSGDGLRTCLRRPVHSFGWDIFPRMALGGIVRDVSLEIRDAFSFADFSYFVKTAEESRAAVVFVAAIDAPYHEFKKNVQIRIVARCGEHEFSHTENTNHSKICRMTVGVSDPKLWWPYGYGEANVYDLTAELLFDGEVKDTIQMNLGIRTVKLLRTETMKEENHCFQFVVNGVDIMCRGSNWVPADALHSKAPAKYEKALELFRDTHCNILRVWGGGAYETEEFYNRCDRLGIMVWQDFCMACRAVPYEGKMYEKMKKEATWVVKNLRHHPSIILWSGDNEIDESLAVRNKRTGMNKITRELLPDVIDIHDTCRPYLPSSPYIADKESAVYINHTLPEADIFPERHLWGTRDYFKADYYSHSKAHFVSEMGYHGCPSPESVKKTVDEGFEWPIYNEQWSLHSADQTGRLHLVKLMEDQIAQLFGFRPDNLEDFSLASQISQAEAKKYFIERIRIKKPYTSGIIWWNMLDGWPQMSNAVVDYFFEKKLAYGYVKRSQEPVCLMIDEMRDWHYTLVATNDTRETAEGAYKVYDVMTKSVLTEGTFKVSPDKNEKLCGIRMMYSDQAFLVIEWQTGRKTYYNHYLAGFPAFDFEAYKNWLSEFEKISETHGK